MRKIGHLKLKSPPKSGRPVGYTGRISKHKISKAHFNELAKRISEADETTKKSVEKELRERHCEVVEGISDKESMQSFQKIHDVFFYNPKKT